MGVRLLYSTNKSIHAFHIDIFNGSIENTTWFPIICPIAAASSLLNQFKASYFSYPDEM